MGTKNNPGDYDCYTKLDPDEPFFVIRAKDPAGPMLVRLWIAIRRLTSEYGYEKLEEAERIAMEMEDWFYNN